MLAKGAPFLGSVGQEALPEEVQKMHLEEQLRRGQIADLVLAVSSVPSAAVAQVVAADVGAECGIEAEFAENPLTTVTAATIVMENVVFVRADVTEDEGALLLNVANIR